MVKSNQYDWIKKEKKYLQKWQFSTNSKNINRSFIFQRQVDSRGVELVVENIQEEREEERDPSRDQDHHHRAPAQMVLNTVKVLDSHLIFLEVVVEDGQ